MRITDELLESLSWNRIHMQQSLTICLQFPLGKLQEKRALHAIHQFEHILKDVIEKTAVGEFGGSELDENWGEGHATFFIYGKDADAIYDVVSPIIAFLPRCMCSSIVRHYRNVQSKCQFSSSKTIH